MECSALVNGRQTREHEQAISRHSKLIAVPAATDWLLPLPRNNLILGAQSSPDTEHAAPRLFVQLHFAIHWERRLDVHLKGSAPSCIARSPDYDKTPDRIRFHVTNGSRQLVIACSPPARSD